MGSLAERMVAGADAERRRLERLLHDGAQQRLAALNATLALAARRLAAGKDTGELVAEAGEEARRCLEELRELARRIYPVVLAERGLDASLTDLARRAAGFAEVVATVEERLPEPVEVTAHLVAWAALSNLPNDGEATLGAALGDGELRVWVEGSSLTAEQRDWLADRAQALGGRLEAAVGEPGRVEALLPVALG